jgi:flagellin
MPSVINTNLASMFAQKSLASAQGNLATSVQRLSSGLRINSAKDDAAGLSVAQNMQSQINAINMAGRNITDATNMLTTADSSLGTIQDILLRMKSLIVEGKNDSLSNAQRGNIYTELNQLDAEINSVAVKTTFNGNSLLASAGAVTATGTFTGAGMTSGTATLASSVVYDNPATATYTFSTSAGLLTLTSNATGAPSMSLAVAAAAPGATTTYDFSTFGIKLNFVSSSNETATSFQAALTGKTIIIASGVSTLGFQSGSNTTTDSFSFSALNVRTDNLGANADYTAVRTALNSINTAGDRAAYNTAFNTASSNIDTAINTMNSQRATLGAQMNRLGYVSSALMSQSTNMAQSRSAIIDTDFAAETSALTKGQIMQQAATAMLAQANQMPNVILSLLK